MSEQSILTEQVNPDLLDVSQTYKIVLLDDRTGESKYEESVKLANPFEFKLKDFLPNDQLMDLPRFFDIANDVINDAQRREGIKAGRYVKLVEDFNAEEFQRHGEEVIAWRVISREPGKMDSDAMGRPQRRPLFSYDLRSPDTPNKVIVVSSMPKDHIVEFTCWSKVASLANKRANWLETLFINHSWAFITQGVERFYWHKRIADSFMEVSGQRLYQRPQRFFVRLREFHSLAHPAMQTFNFNVKLTT